MSAPDVPRYTLCPCLRAALAEEARLAPHPRPMPAVVFLDVDGVLNNTALYEALRPRYGSTRPEDWLDSDCVARVNRLCAETGATVVLSSGWRRHLGIIGARDALRAGGLAAWIHSATPVLDVLPHDHPDAVRLHRWAEISAWLGAHPQVTRWVVIDDIALEGVPTARFVRTDIAVGITEADAERAAAALGAP